VLKAAQITRFIFQLRGVLPSTYVPHPRTPAELGKFSS